MSNDKDNTQIKKEVLQWQNKLRPDHQAFIAHLEDHLKHFKEDLFTNPGEIGIITNEGTAAVKEAIQFFKKWEGFRETRDGQ